MLSDLQGKLKKFGLGWFTELVKSSPFSEWIKEAFHKKPKSKYPVLHSLKKTFEQDTLLIEDLTKKNLSHWR